MPMNTNKELFSYIQLFVIFGHLSRTNNKGNLKLFAVTYYDLCGFAVDAKLLVQLQLKRK
jgi:hypothetical protein